MISGWIIALSPAFAIWSSALYKEGFILIVLFLIVEHTLLLQQDLRLSSLLILPAGLLGMFGLRFYMGALLTVITLVGLLLVRPGRSDRRSGVPTLVRTGRHPGVHSGCVFWARNLRPNPETG